MLSDTHGNALWLSAMYRDGAAITDDESLDEDERLRRQQEYIGGVMDRMSPDLVIHTGGCAVAHPVNVSTDTIAGCAGRRGG